MVTLCPHCGAMYNIGDEYHNQPLTCSYCNNAFNAAAAQICPACNTPNHPGVPACAACQTPFAPQELSFDQEVALAVQDFNKRKLYDSLYWFFSIPCILFSAAGCFFLVFAAILGVLYGISQLFDDMTTAVLRYAVGAIMGTFASIGGGCLGGAFGLNFLYRKINPDKDFPFGTFFLIGALVGLITLLSFLYWANSQAPAA